MIRFHISAGHSCSVDQTDGGLQPRIEDLNIPPDWFAKFKQWQNRCDANMFLPSFRRRKEFDREGRMLAEELQQMVGDRFHVVFRHWVEFDRQQWRTRWREEDVLTGKGNEFWIENDIPDNLAVKVVRIRPELPGVYLWDLNGCCIGNETVSYSDELDQRFEEWSRLYDSCYDHQAVTLDRRLLAETKFDDVGILLAAELKRSVGDLIHVLYHFTLCDGLAEVFADGTVRPWSHGDLNQTRQWVLDTLRDHLPW